MPVLIAITAVLCITLLVVWRKWREAKRADFIRSWQPPRGLLARLRKKRPELSDRDARLVTQALRQFFLAHLKSGRQFVSMPSQVVDDLWHELILYTRNYELFCRRAFGRFLHHTPAVVLSADKQNNSGLRRVWYYTCKEDNINPRQPSRLPLLFAIDAKLGIADGFVYSPDCRALRASSDSGTVHCGGDFSSSSIDGSTDGFGDFGGDASGDSSDGGGDGGDGGCGGGCGGGD